MIRAVIFDCFGVLTTEGWLPFKKKHFGHDQALFDEASDQMKQAGSGIISGNEFIRRVANMAEVSKDFVAQQISGSRTNEELFDYIRSALKPKYKIGLLSNTGSNVLHDLFSEDEIALFDDVTLSYEIGVVKPDREAYAHALNQLGIAAEEAVFIDDQERYCTGAREAGMQAIQYKDFDQMKQELDKLLSASKH